MYEPGADSDERIRQAIRILLDAGPKPRRERDRPTELSTAPGTAAPVMPASRLLLTAEETVEELSISRGRVYELIASGRPKSVKIGKSRRISRRALEAFVADLEAE